ncbi:hypothetical protein HYV89_02170 [Candidatus Woesearchaeota archaeon]|nr:hypothetical protein [Candidatus Woesearchaeota archaeon]
MHRRKFLASLASLAASVTVDLEAQQHPSIIFHFESVPQGVYPMTIKDRKKIEDLVLEAALQFNSRQYVPQPVNLISSDYRTEIYFSENQRRGSFYPFARSCTINLDSSILPFDGHLLSVAFHEFSHEYDVLCGEFENQIQENERCRSRNQEVKNDEIDENRLRKLMHQGLLIKREILRSEVSAYTRNLAYLPSLKTRKWSPQHTLEYHQENLQSYLKANSRELYFLEQTISSSR